ncbi:MAG: acetyl-CoA carboxylase, carboxyltransferase subunit beta [Candidatus Kapabacteria bacterium]|nr:acetyl-CoA carboxylase, carboxyltransferase subunit beta [Candidatus Kapabacteria bacterium]MCS7170254.1 acetyl-CoA carboxylase, carboxyltransferase subunit beta [Candidatus Kapabacteria bacterium]MDW7996327.1 acetyl-CoA carboxylase, carboxyltransferase subunit beta [Bacteroidota bacterium]MDW8225968.1 acetyl-CoA carboxylase, carboxyltransferase subunit beta [Bacteroidota bacterium]
MAWFLRKKPNIEETHQRELPEGLWTKCPRCSAILYKRQLEDNLYTCPQCTHHFRIGSRQYIAFLLDSNSFQETHTELRSADPLQFVDTKPYQKRLEEAYRSSGLNEALTTGLGHLAGRPIVFGCMNFSFIGGSMGSVVGEKFRRAVSDALERGSPLVVVCASGGARMQEGALSLMQMAKTAAALTQLAEARLPYITVLTDPTTGGVTASFAMLGDIIVAEPGALIGFAGPRVIEQATKRKLPEGFQRAEFLQEHGFVDCVVHRKELRPLLARLLDLLC